MGEGKRVVRTYPAGVVKTTVDETANDSDKTFTVPANKQWRIISMRISLNTTATVGNRFIRIIISNTTPSEVFYNQAPSSLAASLGLNYITAANSAASAGSMVALAFPSDFRALAGWTVRILDGAAIDPAADDMSVYIVYEELDV